PESGITSYGFSDWQYGGMVWILQPELLIRELFTSQEGVFMNKQTDLPIADVQSSLDTRRIAIDRVGIKAIRHPVRVADKDDGIQYTVAQFNMYVNLPHNFKGTHMSRFVEILNSHEREISVESFEDILRSMVKKLESDSGHIEMTFPYFVNKSAPISGVQSLLDYEVTFAGEIKKSQYEFTMKVVVP